MMEARIVALDKVTGGTKWTFDGPTGHPSYADGTVYAMSGLAGGSGDPTLYAIDAADGTQQWRRSLPGRVSSTQAPVVADGSVYVAPRETQAIHALSTDDGSEQWRYETAGWVVSPPTVADGSVYLGGRSSTVHCIRASDGKQRWTQVFSSWTNTPTVVDGTVLVGTRDGDVWALTGK
ncbi:PQQ-like beta-propeller repeat protein [Haloarchaeobius sp. HME9146]|uniref:PQQ-like beta-propeller repeat protein n=1 Tax=Haloarchaeobius sp. HME9146 TaxID=2978732 RepID=UPI0021C0BAAE|nr:PQQ-like beta-propeller repeat protein [Haloarchaeobius sp. HME9146]MCT9096619.1 PQQ-like beta-propeller repeat protein [Haloarchaeobius sp. HME9146]